MKSIAIIGKIDKAFLSYIEQSHPEVEVIVLYDKNDLYDFPPSVKKSFTLDFSSKETCLADLKKLPDLQIMGLETQFENGILPKAWIGEALGLPVLEEASALAVTDKGQMRKQFLEKNPSISPAFAVIESWQDILHFISQVGFPVMLKPANLSKSLLITKSTTVKELQENFYTTQQKIKEIYTQYGVYYRKPTLIIEEFLSGPLFSIDAYRDSSNNIKLLPIVDLVMAPDIGIPDMYNYKRLTPSMTSVPTQRLLEAVAREGVEALNLTNTPAHCELVLTNKGPKIIEIGARFGGYRTTMYKLSYGIDLSEILYALSIGQPITVNTKEQAYTAVYELFPDKAGVFQDIEQWDTMQTLASFYAGKQKNQSGEMIGLAHDGFKFCANIILSHQNKETFEHDCSFIEKNVHVRVT